MYLQVLNATPSQRIESLAKFSNPYEAVALCFLLLLLPSLLFSLLLLLHLVKQIISFGCSFIVTHAYCSWNCRGMEGRGRCTNIVRGPRQHFLVHNFLAQEAFDPDQSGAKLYPFALLTCALISCGFNCFSRNPAEAFASLPPLFLPYLLLQAKLN